MISSSLDRLVLNAEAPSVVGLSAVALLHLVGTIVTIALIAMIALDFFASIMILSLVRRSPLSSLLRRFTDKWYQQPESSGSVIELSPQEKAAWSGTATNVLLLLMGALSGMTIAGRGSAISMLGGAAWVLTIAGSSSVRVNIGESGVDLRTRPLWLRKSHFALEDIDSAAVMSVRPLLWGGWGFRVALSQQAGAFVVRGGPALVVYLKSGGRLVVTVNGARDGAGLLNALLSRRASCASPVHAGGFAKHAESCSLDENRQQI